ncbi:Hypothetical protein I5071_62530 [Sandaracinus amylolyticus]|nr:Hypothetical protein I5071_62530 [Sandaracinus amylolyticus]
MHSTHAAQTLPELGQRFEVRGLLGAGASGTVWAARDRDLGADVALKLLAQRSADEARALKREFRLLRHLRHRGLVQFYELLEVEGRLVLSMEIVDASSSDAVELVGATDLVRQVFEALAALHTAGVVHGDVKPSNVLVDRAGRAVLLDFGLATSTGAGTVGRRFAGTLHYAAPETVYRARRDAASDVFSAAATAIELLAGRRFARPWAMTASERPAPSWSRYLRAPISDDLQRLLSLALLPDATRRPSADELARALGGSTREPSTARVVGRDAEIDSLAARIATGQQRFAVVHVCGPAGIGKTAVVRAAVSMARDALGARLLASRCDPIESLRFQALDGVVDAMADDPAFPEILGSLPPAQRTALLHAFPALVAHVEPPPAVPVEIGALVGAVRGALRGLGERAPTILWIDDAHAIDADSATILAQCIRDEPERTAVVLTYRAHEGPLLSALDRSALGDGVQLGPLPRAITCELASAHGAGARTESIADQSEGNAYLTIELAREVLAASGGDGALDATARDVLLQIAVCGAPVPAHVILAASGHEDRARALFGLCRSGALDAVRRSDAPALSFSQESMRQRITAAATQNDVRRASASVARAWADTGRAEPAVLARLYETAHDWAAAHERALEAALRAERGLAFGQAADMYELAVRADDTAFARVVDAWVRCLSLAGRPTRAVELCLRASEELGVEGADRFRAAAANLLLSSGDLERAFPLIDRALSSLGMRRPSGAVGAALGFFRERASLALSSGLPRRAPIDAHRLEQGCDTLASLSSIYGIVDTVTGATFQSRMLRWARELGPGPQLLRATANELVYTGVMRGTRAPARLRVDAELRALEDAVDDPEARAYVLAARGYEAFMTARFAEARPLLSSAALAYERLGGARWPLSLARAHVCLADAWLDRLDVLERELPDVQETLHVVGDRLIGALLEVGAGYLLELARNRPEAALERLERAMSPWNGVRPPALEYLYLRARVQIDLCAGRHDRFEEYFARFDRSRWAVGAQANRIELAWFHGLIAHARRRDHIVRTSIAKLDRERTDWASALGLVLRANLARAARDERASALSDRAAHALEQSGLLTYARLWREAGCDGDGAIVNPFCRLVSPTRSA